MNTLGLDYNQDLADAVENEDQKRIALAKRVKDVDFQRRRKARKAYRGAQAALIKKRGLPDYGAGLFWKIVESEMKWIEWNILFD